MQLPPVASVGRPTFAYESPSWQNGRIKACYLSGQYRQGEDGLLRVLTALREENMDDEAR